MKSLFTAVLIFMSFQPLAWEATQTQKDLCLEGMRKGDYSIVLDLLDKGMNPDTRISAISESLLFGSSHYAFNGYHEETEKLFFKLLELGADVEWTGEFGRFPLNVASNVRKFAALHAAGADISRAEINSYGVKTPLQLSHSENYEILEYMFKNNVEPDCKGYSSIGSDSEWDEIEELYIEWFAAFNINDPFEYCW
ncbi:hypothetical protein A9Q84_00095 [Halobacteriovorax marinus]|uniref:Ankyrin repeat domain-containing protein n=1 Tax=Halobacteriovorax marinus TaxID=97084 RepID=A0A1Y5FDE2_9BACT|nr:hypothetical protein A9Q84_00095 [Halobacteriovorax marinus]